MKLNLPIISSNMDTVTGSEMARAMFNSGAVGSLHRFSTIEDNVKQFLDSPNRSIVSVGLGISELDRALALSNAGAFTILVDVAHGASMKVVQQVKDLRGILPEDTQIIVGNFATARSIKDFLYHLGNYRVDAWKVGIGGGSACLTRVVTGCGMPTLASVIDCASLGLPIIADGGMRNSGDIAKALAAGATTVMLGGMLAGTLETPGEVIWDQEGGYLLNTGHKKYRGSASTESYEVQGKIASHRSYEGDSYLVPYKGPVKDILQQIEGGLRSSLSYVGANNLEEFRERATLVQITGQGFKENGSHGKRS
jgi:IMP dehydrogenase